MSTAPLTADSDHVGHRTAPVVDAAHAAPYDDPESYQLALTEIRAAAAAYYAGADSAIDDAVYDALLARATATETAHPDWKQPDSPTATVAAGAVTGDIAHSTPMLSLDNVFDADGLRTWAARLDRILGRPAGGYTVEPKVDGMAASARYVGGRLHQLVTRGDGQSGEDVTTQARLVAGLPAQLTEAVTTEVRGEVFMTDADFARANELRLAHGGSPFTNPRQATAGTLRARNRVYDAPLSFLAYDVHDDAVGSRTAAMDRMAALGVATTAGSTAGMARCADITDVVAAVQTLGQRRGQLGFGIDGAVVKADDSADRHQAGSSSRAPRWAIAYKFPADTRTTTLVGIDVQVGRTGVITPVAVLAPVEVGGVTVTSATLHNFVDLVRRDVRAGDTVYVRRAGDVIPEITGAKLDDRPGDATAFAPPECCPRCGSDIDRSQKRWRCSKGRTCGAPEALIYFASRDSMDIEGLGDTIIRNLVARGLALDPADLYDLDADVLAQLDRLGRTSAAKLVDSIQASKAQPLSRVLTALGIRHTGRRLSRRLARHFGTMQALLDADAEQLRQVDGIGTEKAAAIAAELAELAPVVAKLAERGVTMTDASALDTSASGPTPQPGQLPLGKSDGTPMTVVVTGTVPGLTRTEGNEAVEALGGKSAGSVTTKTDLVVVGDGAGSKARKAEELKIPIMAADKFAALCASHAAGDTVTLATYLT